MARGSHVTTYKRKGKAIVNNEEEAVPAVYREMLAEVLPIQCANPDRPLKKRRTGRSESAAIKIQVRPVEEPIVAEKDGETGNDDIDNEDDVQFEDVIDVFGDAVNAEKSIQVAYMDSEDESAESEAEWDMDLDTRTSPEHVESSGDFELTLKSHIETPRRIAANRRRVISKEERGLRLQIHKMHLLCLLAHLEKRNRWCNDGDVQSALQPLVTKKMEKFLLPKSSLSQFSRTESLKRGLDQACSMWRAQYRITTKGMQRSLWVEDQSEILRLQLASETDSTFDKSDFKTAAGTLRGSRDVGVQLFCALLRGVGLEVRLVCSLQPLSFTSGGPTAKGASQAVQAASSEDSDESGMVDIYGNDSPFTSVNRPVGSTSNTPPTARQRLGHPNAADYHLPQISAPSRAPSRLKPSKIRESPYPIFWVEVLDEAHQKYLPVDPLVTNTIAKPSAFEPPASDRENNLSYAIAFEDDSIARDVTRKYTKAFNAKTRKQRVDSTKRGQEWWRKALRLYTRRWRSDIDQIEDAEFAAAEAREPMPKNVADFKDHPYYALERHMKRNEILVTRHEVGRIATGRDPTTHGKKRLESVYRRRDIKTAKSADAWYRLGREIKMGGQPMKTIPARRKVDRDAGDGEGNPGLEAGDMNLYIEDQTELFVSPPVVNGRIPKNSFGNIDIYVPSMIPLGGVHMPDPNASYAARLLNIDYAPALTGFSFRGRKGTAILQGVVVAGEYENAMLAVVEGIKDEQVRIEEERKSAAALRAWKRFLIGLRIRKTVAGYADGESEEEEEEEEGEEEAKEERHDLADEKACDVNSDYEHANDVYGGGGFLPE